MQINILCTEHLKRTEKEKKSMEIDSFLIVGSKLFFIKKRTQFGNSVKKETRENNSVVSFYFPLHKRSR